MIHTFEKYIAPHSLIIGDEPANQPGQASQSVDQPAKTVPILAIPTGLVGLFGLFVTPVWLRSLYSGHSPLSILY